MNKFEWFKLKRYPHIGLPINWQNKDKVCSYIKNEDKIKKHSFFPFIHKTIVSRKFRKEYDKYGNLLNCGMRKAFDPKIRNIYYSNHLDSNIFGYYAHLLNKKYEKKLNEKKISDVVIAYRKIPFKSNMIRSKCNIDFANEVFEHIRENSDKDIVAVTFDIKDFFDSLKHRKLKQAWCNVLGVQKLNDDHYNIFRNITKYSFVEEKELFNLFKDKIIVKSPSGITRKKKVHRLRYLKNQGAIAFCDSKDIHIIRKKGLIHSNKYKDSKLRDFGICQGSSISAILANIYMLEFDECIFNEVKEYGYYRRYSDDMVIVCPKDKKEHLISFVTENIKSITELEIKESKTQIFHFFTKDNKTVCAQEFNNELNKNSFNRRFEYLGFSFNGHTTSVKTSTIAKYYMKMKKSVKLCIFYSKIIKNKTKGQIFKRRLYKRYSYIGSRRSKKYQRVKGTTDKWIETNKYNWGNFITYAKLAMRTIKKNNIHQQISRHWKNLNNQLKKYKH